MAFIDTTAIEHTPGKTPGWEALMAQLDMTRVAPLKQRPIQAELSQRMRNIQQMLLASVLAAGMVIAVAGVMMIKFL